MKIAKLDDPITIQMTCARDGCPREVFELICDGSVWVSKVKRCGKCACSPVVTALSRVTGDAMAVALDEQGIATFESHGFLRVPR